MQQLWLNGTRIDCIDQLRAEMDRQQETMPDDLCLELVRQYRMNILGPWLRRQWESCPAAGAEASDDEELKNTHGAIVRLLSEGLSEDDAEAALAVLAGVDVERFSSLQQRDKLQQIQSREKARREQLEGQSWYRERKQEFACIKEESWEYVVLNQKQLADVMTRLRQDERTGSESVTVYLCGSDEMAGGYYTLNLQGVRNVVIKGIQNPSVRYSRWAKKTDPKENNVVFQNLEIRHL